MPRAKPTNPFYVLLLVDGLLFTVSASAYFVMMYREAHPSPHSETIDAVHPLWPLLQEYGLTAILVQLGLLAIFTFAAIGTDEYWSNRSNVDEKQNEPTDSAR